MDKKVTSYAAHPNQPRFWPSGPILLCCLACIFFVHWSNFFCCSLYFDIGKEFQKSTPQFLFRFFRVRAAYQSHVEGFLFWITFQEEKWHLIYEVHEVCTCWSGSLEYIWFWPNCIMHSFAHYLKNTAITQFPRKIQMIYFLI